MSEILYAPAVLADLPAVVELCMLVEAQHEAYWPLRWQRRAGLPEGYLAWLTHRLDDPRMFIHVAKDSAPVAEPPFSREPTASARPGQVVGMILVNIQKEIPVYTYDEFALIQDMAVRVTHRRRGIAQQLLKLAAAWAQSHHLNQLRLMVADQNPDARKAFEKAGFQPTYHEMILPLTDQQNP